MKTSSTCKIVYDKNDVATFVVCGDKILPIPISQAVVQQQPVPSSDIQSPIGLVIFIVVIVVLIFSLTRPGPRADGSGYEGIGG